MPLKTVIRPIAIKQERMTSLVLNHKGIEGAFMIFVVYKSLIQNHGMENIDNSISSVPFAGKSVFPV